MHCNHCHILMKGPRHGRPMLTQGNHSLAEEAFEPSDSNTKLNEFKKDEVEEKEEGTVKREKPVWNVDRSMLPMSFGKPISDDSPEDMKPIKRDFHPGQRINQEKKEAIDVIGVDNAGLIFSIKI